MGATMNDMPNELFQKWGHSFEEDTGDIVVYRPAHYDFPRARGRAGIEFRADGEFVDWTIGPGDAQQGVNGRWQVEAPGRMRISFAGAIRPPRVLEIVQCDANMLRVRQRPASP
jgi:hypothetical protein